VLAFASGNFLYVAMADLIPSLHRGGPGQAAATNGGAFLQVLLIAAGTATIVLL
jgi:zinc transporter ZupT